MFIMFCFEFDSLLPQTPPPFPSPLQGGSDEKMPVIVTRVSPNSPVSLFNFVVEGWNCKVVE